MKNRKRQLVFETQDVAEFNQLRKKYIEEAQSSVEHGTAIRGTALSTKLGVDPAVVSLRIPTEVKTQKFKEVRFTVSYYTLVADVIKPYYLHLIFHFLFFFFLTSSLQRGDFIFQTQTSLSFTFFIFFFECLNRLLCVTCVCILFFLC
jgi:hypothetical protein